MCKAKEYIKQISNIYDNMQKEYKNLSTENSKTDLMMQDILHKIEFENFNACEGYKLAKQIKDVRAERRQYKNELEAMQSLMDSIKPTIKTIKKVEGKVIEIERKQKAKTYKPRVLKAQ